MTHDNPFRLGFFTRVLDIADPAERYRLALDQIVHAEACGFETAWVAQHHFHEFEGGMPAPMVFLAQAAARTAAIRLGTGIITLPLEAPLRIAEDASVLDVVSGGRLEAGVGPGGNLSAFHAFGLDPAERATLFQQHLDLLRAAWNGDALPGGDRLYPANAALARRIWQATFTVQGARRAGLDGDGLLLSRTQPRPADAPGRSLADIQNPLVDAYLSALPSGCAPRILASRSVFAADDRAEAMRLAEIGLARARARLADTGRSLPGTNVREWIAAQDVHVGAADDVAASLAADPIVARATDVAVQVHSVDPPHALILRSIELMAERVAPALGWVRPGAGSRKAA